jgi:hypothetical protein
MKCLTLFALLIVLSQVFLAIMAKKNSHKSHSANNKNEPSFNGLPPYWTTGFKSDVAYQINKKHVDYNRRLANVHRYQDNTKSLLRKSLRAK